MRRSDRHPTLRRGFTLIEVLALAAGLVLLTALTLPAVLQAREDARIQQCKNNLKQLGIAMHNYHDIYRMFPPGWITRRQEGAGHPSTGWMSSILQYVDQTPIFQQLDLGKRAAYECPDVALLKKSLAIYRCPVDSLGDANELRGGWGTSNYVGNYGATPIARWSGAFSNDFWPGQSLTPQASGRPYGAKLKARGRGKIIPPYIRPSGMFYMNRGGYLRDALDGTSNTLLIGERCAIGGGGLWPGPRSNFHESDVVADASYASPLNGGTPGFSSRHRGVVNFVMCDGSVHVINENIDSSPQFGTLQKLAMPYDGQPIQ